jgi:hypothetical protein
MKLAVVLFVALCLSSVWGDVYMHNPRGSNNRLNEANTNRDSNNRLCNTQNNAKGGYAYGPPMYYYTGSYLQVEWTNQHGCGGNQNVQCQIILQYMCGDSVRDGTTTTQIPDDENEYNAVVTNPDTSLYFGGPNPDDNKQVYKYGMHESYQYYQDCKRRERNKGLFTADQNPGNAATNTRQNPGGGRSGFECPEERDYYPYWHPTPWKDIAVLTDDTGMCKFYHDNSENNKGRNFCAGAPTFNNEGECNANGGSWEESGTHGGTISCVSAPFSRDNHLGNGVKNERGEVGTANSYYWKIPDDENEHCVLRLRYNISSFDYNGWDTDAASNGAVSPVTDDPTIIQGGQNITLAIDTTQFGRTFQDRSYTFAIRDRDSSILPTVRIWNLNVRGKRGNIVQVYPAVESDFVPNYLQVRSNDYIHFQWTGSKFNPQGNDGEGTRGTDVHNLVITDNIGGNIPGDLDDASEFIDRDTRYRFCHLDQTNCSTYAQLLATHGNNQDDIDRDPTNCAKLNAAGQYFDGGEHQFTKDTTYHYQSTRQNNFTNRSQKGTIEVQPFLPVWAIVLVVFAGVVCLASIAVGGVGFASRFFPDSKLDVAWKKLTSF